MEEMFDPNFALKIGFACGFITGWFVVFVCSTLYDLADAIRNNRKEKKKDAISNSSDDHH